MRRHDDQVGTDRDGLLDVALPYRNRSPRRLNAGFTRLAQYLQHRGHYHSTRGGFTSSWQGKRLIRINTLCLGPTSGNKENYAYDGSDPHRTAGGAAMDG